ncbi:hypothetical protein D915_008497, partial [Fasciola hepatica]
NKSGCQSQSVQYSHLLKVDPTGAAHRQEYGRGLIAPIPTSDHLQGGQAKANVSTADALEQKPEPVDMVDPAGEGCRHWWTLGAVCSVIREDIVPLLMTIDPTANIILIAANGKPIQTTGCATVTIDLGNLQVTQRVTVAQRLPWNVI